MITLVTYLMPQNKSQESNQKSDDSLAFCGLLHPLKSGRRQGKTFTTFNKWVTGGKPFRQKEVKT